jgi:hypothetical protein
MTFVKMATGATALSMLAAMLICEATPARADLTGATVSFGSYSGTSPVTAADLFTNVLTGTVPVSFPVGSLHSVIPPNAVILSTFDITADQIIRTFTASAMAGCTPSPCNFVGQVFDFSGLSSPISNATVDPLSTLIPVSVEFTGNSVAVNLEGESVTPDEQYIVDVTTGPPAMAPEPSSLVLLGSAFGLLAFRLGRSAGPRRADRFHRVRCAYSQKPHKPHSGKRVFDVTSRSARVGYDLRRLT